MIFDTAATISGVRPGVRGRKRIGVGFRRKQPVAEAADGQVGHGREGIPVPALEDQRGHVVAVHLQHVLRKLRQRQVGKAQLRRQPFHRPVGGQGPPAGRPLRSGEALARSVLSDGKPKARPLGRSML